MNEIFSIKHLMKFSLTLSNIICLYCAVEDNNIDMIKLLFTSKKLDPNIKCVLKNHLLSYKIQNKFI